MTNGKRLNHEPPVVTAKLGWRYHHIGIPYTLPRVREHHVARLGVHVSGFETSPYGIEWIRYEPHCNVPEIVRSVPHIAFAVDDGAPGATQAWNRFIGATNWNAVLDSTWDADASWDIVPLGF